MLVYGSRTFSNTIEMILFSLLLRTVVLHVTDANEVRSRRFHFGFWWFWSLKGRILQEYPRRDELNASLRTADSPREKVLILRQLRRLTHRDYSGSSQVALLTVIGIFNRPTFVAYAVGPVFFWLYRGVPLKKLSCYSLHLRSLYLLSVAAPVALVFVFFDTIYYKHRKRHFLVVDRVGKTLTLVSYLKNRAPLENFEHHSWLFVKLTKNYH